VIRRGFWLIVGAAGGIMGYRRVSSLTRQVSETLGARPKPPGTVRRYWARETIRFTRDVREGMDLYSVRHPRASSPTLGPGSQSRRSPAAPFIEAPGKSTDDEKNEG
jgi:hypothetical protein